MHEPSAHESPAQICVSRPACTWLVRAIVGVGKPAGKLMTLHNANEVARATVEAGDPRLASRITSYVETVRLFMRVVETVQTPCTGACCSGAFFLKLRDHMHKRQDGSGPASAQENDAATKLFFVLARVLQDQQWCWCLSTACQCGLSTS